MILIKNTEERMKAEIQVKVLEFLALTEVVETDRRIHRRALELLQQDIVRYDKEADYEIA